MSSFVLSYKTFITETSANLLSRLGYTQKHPVHANFKRVISLANELEEIFQYLFEGSFKLILV